MHWGVDAGIVFGRQRGKTREPPDMMRFNKSSLLEVSPHAIPVCNGSFKLVLHIYFEQMLLLFSGFAKCGHVFGVGINSFLLQSAAFFNCVDPAFPRFCFI